jgi:hypothetical protein
MCALESKITKAEDITSKRADTFECNKMRQHRIFVFITDHFSCRKKKNEGTEKTEKKNKHYKTTTKCHSFYQPLRGTSDSSLSCNEKFILCIMDAVSLFDISFDPFLGQMGIMS